MYRLLTDMSIERLTRLYEALPAPLARALDGPIGAALNSRPASVLRHPPALRVKALRNWILRRRDEVLAGDLLRAYLLGPRKGLVMAFLDATGVAHEDGQLKDDGALPAEERVGPAVEALLGAHDRDDVHLYLGVAAVQWPGSAAVRAALAASAPAG